MPARGTSKTALASLVESCNEDSLPGFMQKSALLTWGHQGLQMIRTRRLGVGGRQRPSLSPLYSESVWELSFTSLPASNKELSLWKALYRDG